MSDQTVQLLEAFEALPLDGSAGRNALDVAPETRNPNARRAV